jgi:hypothetical protein
MTGKTSSATQLRERVLENMFIGNAPGNYDRVFDFPSAYRKALLRADR